MLDRFRCRLLGCLQGPYDPYCLRCGADSYEPDWIEWGWWDRLLYPWRRLRSWVYPRCHQCGRRMFWRRLLGRSHNGELCSRECFDRWIPF